ncbi:MAG: transglycosylase SLT domain-containing protein [Gemmatimonadota bacterium]
MFRYHASAATFMIAAVLFPAPVGMSVDRAETSGARPAQPFVWTRSGAARDLAYYLDLRVDAAQRDRGIAVLKRAISQTDSKQYTTALKSFESAARLLPNLGDWITAFAAGVSATVGDTADVNRRLSTLDSLLRVDWAWRTQVRAYRNANDIARATRQSESYAELAGSPRRRSEAWRAIGEMRLETGDTASAVIALTQAMDVWPNSDAALEAARLLSPLPGITGQHQLRIGRIYLRYGNEKRGLEGLRAFLTASGIPADTIARVRLEIGRAHFAAGRYNDAAKVFSELARASTVSSAAEALYLAGRSQYRGGDEADGRRTLIEVAKRFPTHPIAAQALFLAGDLAQDEQQLAQATEFFEQATQAGPHTEPAGIAHMRLAGIALAAGNKDLALKRFEDYAAAFSTGVRHQQAVFWVGRTRLDLGQRDTAQSRLRQARDLDPYSYYGLRAAELLGQSVFTDRLGESPTTPARTSGRTEAGLNRIDIMRQVGWNEAATFEQDRVRRHFDGNVPALYSLAEGLNRRNRASVGITIARELYRAAGSVWNTRLLRIAYPFPYRDLIVKQATSRGIDPHFMVALIRQESAFNPTAVSSAGAMGLMQVMPTTGRGLARTFGIKRFKSSMLHDPDINVRMGAKFLADMMKSWKNRPDYVLAAYNAGPSRMARWVHFQEAGDPDLFLERIPYDETRDYVRVVQLNARIYERLYGSKGTAPKTDK